MSVFSKITFACSLSLSLSSSSPTSSYSLSLSHTQTRSKFTAAGVLLKGLHVCIQHQDVISDLQPRWNVRFLSLSDLKNSLRALYHHLTLTTKTFHGSRCPEKRPAVRPQRAFSAGGNWILVFLCPPLLLSVLSAGGVIMSALIRRRPRAPSASHYSQ